MAARQAGKGTLRQPRRTAAGPDSGTDGGADSGLLYRVWCAGPVPGGYRRNAGG
ncbi:hypothetical protein O7626_19485 [Micromonospora sp. WMMD1102]|uniref:hypothetical protein n=1 Tax=Micromonospora sp. WMMD1102 TaxID=3016105 RepID=UPI002414EEB4|nr:hypothetical protein [Micromonospora sp. WMMD1102]MDG4788097.1 hypothetical protein [Micromonospora sp. WMMD1102]